MPDKPRKRISLLAEREKRGRGVGCPKCHGKVSRVDTTWDAPRSRRRHRICSHCGHKYATAEFALADVGRARRQNQHDTENDDGEEEQE